MRILILSLALCPVVSLHAQSPVPPIVQQGLEALARGKCQDAFDLWTASWAEAQKVQMTVSCSALQQFGGEYHGYDVLRTVEVSPHLHRVYLILLYEIQPVYAMLVLYRPTDGAWKVGTLNWNTDPDKVIPSSILPLQRP